MKSFSDKKAYSSPRLVELGSHGAIVAAGGASFDIDGSYVRDGQRFFTAGEEPGPGLS